MNRLNTHVVPNECEGSHLSTLITPGVNSVTVHPMGDSSTFGFVLTRFAEGFRYFNSAAEPALSLSKGSE